MRFMIIGHGRHGKDTLASALATFTGLKNAGSCSEALAPFVAWKKGISVEEAYATRHEPGQREIWRALGDDGRLEHGVDYLVKALDAKGDVGNGIRARAEFVASRPLFDCCIYVSRLGWEFDPTFELEPKDADVVFLNDGTKKDLIAKVSRFARTLRPVTGQKKRVYISCPISRGDPEDNFTNSCNAQFWCMQHGLAPLNPGLSMLAGASPTDPCTPKASGHHPFDTLTYQDWIDTDLVWVEVADAVLRLPGESKGADLETAHAKLLGIPVVTWAERSLLV